MTLSQTYQSNYGILTRIILPYTGKRFAIDSVFMSKYPSLPARTAAQLEAGIDILDRERRNCGLERALELAVEEMRVWVG